MQVDLAGLVTAAPLCLPISRLCSFVFSFHCYLIVFMHFILSWRLLLVDDVVREQQKNI